MTEHFFSKFIPDTCNSLYFWILRAFFFFRTTYLSKNNLAKSWSGRYTATSLKMFQNLDSEPIASRAPGSDSSIHIKDSFLSPPIALQQLSKLSWACRRSHVQCVLIFKICSGKTQKKFERCTAEFRKHVKISSKVYLWVQIYFQNSIFLGIHLLCLFYNFTFTAGGSQTYWS